MCLTKYFEIMATYSLIGRLVCFKIILQVIRDRKTRLNKAYIFQDIRDIPKKKEPAEPRSRREG